MSSFDYIDNHVENIDESYYAAIIGLNPSRGARSPTLWNAAFQAQGQSARMIPMDVSAGNIPALITALNEDKRFLGGAVTMPYKESIAAFLGATRMEPTALRIGAVNCLYRGKHGDLCGANTDGAAALVSIEALIGSIAGKRCLTLGVGGVGKAVAAYLADANAELTLASRNLERDQGFASKIGARLIGMPVTPPEFSELDILINCTSLGFANADVTASPVPLECFSRIPKSCRVFDVIYNPRPTQFLRYAIETGHPVEDGLFMNLEQAVLGFCRANPLAVPDVVRQAMST
ncbi:MAG: hypothetical protein CMM62_03715 [Rhodospirillaceae bacterium]|nr:hypothetical protein [Rhodospirillaceae bacterium]MAX62452.1 hypothetical protein [Rhodospirillaceae bacterium]MBB56850.1 hypothetical protein [Rhodospirillaceae bacterium]|tara:strand:+ start:26430 stop:27302 length:873 start_codon:yes stop_codon:yes gene_type:complete